MARTGPPCHRPGLCRTAAGSPRPARARVRTAPPPDSTAFPAADGWSGPSRSNSRPRFPHHLHDRRSRR
ncbi:hypothetical protein Ae406Ps2_5472 [Pseudonocardia sp. Ae406_Ps2]|nr:hypothetical protein Ae331Ps2_0484c [Pseudonocardia sp. Ae331_Ps2]OLM05472.1 hypothetical protein Ae406Ps2_5472 [Pseudonocardia sp. Ae406_Ps2]OLM15579.1 hypothetical protein Ae505Ps2_5711c [Pseudonocardia sp. Ae505_Ps2]OLM27043.1 hypothetical protein Ae706Ps2_5477 [Pseudonocardia sp. Ae706_Ps2]